MKGAIMLSGGGSGKLFAAIGVTYPAGSTLTCTNGTKTLTAKNTSGQWVFAVPEAGTWTVKAVSGSNSKSQSVSITKEGQLESVTLSYSYEILNSSTNITGGWHTEYGPSNQGSKVTVRQNEVELYYQSNSANQWSNALTKNAFDFSKYKTLKCEVVQTGGGTNGPFKFAVFPEGTEEVDWNYGTNEANEVISKVLIGSGSGVYSIPVDSLTVNACIGFYVQGIGVAPTATLVVKRIWLE